jgi:regulator of cell morphogenesis and NO signaling
MEITSRTRVADVATEHPAAIRVFQRYGIDFCCGGKRALADVCGELNLELGQVKEDLERVLAGPREERSSWQSGSVAEVIGGIVGRYHRPLDDELPRLAQMMAKVLSVHGERHPELADVSGIFRSIREELRPHMRAEEEMLFPYILRLEAAARAGDAEAARRSASLAGPLAAMEDDHVRVGSALAALRERTGGYRAPDDACNTFRGLYHGLEELERELHAHIHVENNILFPLAAELEAGLRRSASARG